ncbi:MAG: DUF1735 domain-containing protein [Bacteroidales bacterium]|nr:DUF1735 domain-containing protein [Bacteroidales bacterium]
MSVALLAASCNTNDRFGEEMYKKVFSLMGNSDNIYVATHSFANTTSPGFVSVLCGGTNPIEEDITVELEYDSGIIDRYNYRYFDLDSARYAKRLDTARYKILSFTATMKAGQADPYATFPLEIYTAGISPDSVYFIPLRIKSVSGNYEVNPDMVSVMYRPSVENMYARTQVATTYSMRGTRGTAEITATKTMYPLTVNQSRITVDNQTGLTDNIANLDLVNRYGIVLTVGDGNLVSLSPYSTIEVETLGDAKENRYEVVAGVRTFYLHYRYRTLTAPATESTPATYSAWTEIEEVLKRQN